MVARLSGPQKAAILLLTLGEDGAAEVMKNLNEEEIKDLGQYMTRFDYVKPADVDRVMNEFYLVAEKGRFLPAPPLTKIEYLKKILERAIGEEHADQVVNGLVTQRPKSPLEQLNWHSPKTIADFLAEEHPQVIAVILANMGDPAVSQEVIAALPDNMQKDILTRYAQIRSIPQDWLDEIEASLGEDMAGPRPKSDGPPGDGTPTDGPLGETQVAKVLATAPQPMEDLLISHIRSKNPELADRISRRIFSFPDLLKIDNYGIQLVLKKTPGSDIVLSLKLADEPLKQHILRNMADDSVAKIQDALEGMGPVPVSRIEAAQKRMATTARQLIEQGEVFPLERRRKEAKG